jgi:hypothetical protein
VRGGGDDEGGKQNDGTKGAADALNSTDLEGDRGGEDIPKTTKYVRRAAEVADIRKKMRRFRAVKAQSASVRLHSQTNSNLRFGYPFVSLTHRTALNRRCRRAASTPLVAAKRKNPEIEFDDDDDLLKPINRNQKDNE